jgi:sialic acid synthase SpsE
MLQPEFVVAGRKVGEEAAPYVIAEAGSNHNHSLDTALRLIDAAAQAQCDAVKFQLFDTDVLYPRDHENYAVFKSVEFSPDWLVPLQSHAKERGIAFFASAFDRTSVDRLAAIDVPAFKIASSETIKLDLLAYIAGKGKPLFISTGMCDLVDVLAAVSCVECHGNHQSALLQCVALYPAKPADANLAVMDTYKAVFGCPTGYSDHVLGTDICLAAVARGATVIEKHFTLDRSSKGPDHFYALEPKELSELVERIRDVRAAIGDGIKDMHPEERRIGRREGLYAARPIKAGDYLDAEAVTIRRPAIGIRARHFNEVIGLFARRAIANGEPINWDDVRP